MPFSETALWWSWRELREAAIYNRECPKEHYLEEVSIWVKVGLTMTHTSQQIYRYSFIY